MVCVECINIIPTVNSCLNGHKLIWSHEYTNFYDSKQNKIFHIFKYFSIKIKNFVYENINFDYKINKN